MEDETISKRTVDYRSKIVDGKAPSYQMLRVRIVHKCSVCGLHRKLVGDLSCAPMEADASVGGYWVLETAVVSCKSHQWIEVGR